MAGERLVQAMQTAGKKPEAEETDLLLGEVTSVSPLKVKLDKIELTEAFLILGALVQDTVVNVPALAASYREDNKHTHPIPEHYTSNKDKNDNPVGHDHKIPAWVTDPDNQNIRLWRGLEVGDFVYLIRCAFGQKYYILQRKEGIT